MSINLQTSTFLGKQISEYKQTYDPSILVQLDRKVSRNELDIKENFQGSDTWHIYELSFLTKNDEPVTALGKLVIPSDSPYFIESESMKMYFYSMNMEKFGNTVEESLKEIKKIVLKDIRKATGSKNVKFDVHIKDKTKDILKQYNYYDTNQDTKKYNKIEVSDEIVEEYLMFPNVRTNCRITHQPDFATYLIHYKGKKLNQKSMLDYIFKIRTENHFHEEATELTFKELSKFDWVFNITALYTRIGGIDICCQRFNHPDFEIKELSNSKKLTRKTLNQ